MRTIVKILARLLSLALAGALAGGCLLAALGYKMYRQALDARSLEAIIAAVQADPGYTPIGQLPPLYLDAVVAVEDHRFAQHSGIDPIAILRAAVHDLRTRSLDQGGSTITQQLAKNLYFTQEKELTRKAAEVFMAFELERNYSKEEILELYVNSIYFGDGYYDVASASEGYFGKTPEELNDYEATLLAGVPNAPSVYAPTKNPDKAEQRRLQVVNRMIACGYITVAESETYAALAADY